MFPSKFLFARAKYLSKIMRQINMYFVRLYKNESYISISSFKFPKSDQQ